MADIFWGFFLVFINFNLSFNAHTLNILPPFLGYLLLARGMESLAAESGLFSDIRPFALGMAVYTAVLWAGDLLGVVPRGMIATLLGLAALAAGWYVSWAVVSAIQDLEERRQAELNGTGLRQAWAAMLITGALTYLSILLPFLTLLFLLASLAAVIAFLAALWKSKERFEALPMPKAAGGVEEA